MADTKKKVEAGEYRVVQVFVTYFEPREKDIGGRKRTLQIHRTGRGRDIITLSQSEAERLVEAGAVVPADEAQSYDELLTDELEALVDERGIDRESIKGSGANGHVLKQDLVDALNADDQQS